jgi:hypothetical protein
MRRGDFAEATEAMGLWTLMNIGLDPKRLRIRKSIGETLRSWQTPATCGFGTGNSVRKPTFPHDGKARRNHWG